jgi:hypothetical protein
MNKDSYTGNMKRKGEDLKTSPLMLHHTICMSLVHLAPGNPAHQGLLIL